MSLSAGNGRPAGNDRVIYINNNCSYMAGMAGMDGIYNFVFSESLRAMSKSEKLTQIICICISKLKVSIIRINRICLHHLIVHQIHTLYNIALSQWVFISFNSNFHTNEPTIIKNLKILVSIDESICYELFINEFYYKSYEIHMVLVAVNLKPNTPVIYLYRVS